MTKTNDLEFLRELLQNLKYWRNRDDFSSRDMAFQMVEDWITELESAPPTWLPVVNPPILPSIGQTVLIKDQDGTPWPAEVVEYVENKQGRKVRFEIQSPYQNTKAASWTFIPD